MFKASPSHLEVGQIRLRVAKSVVRIDPLFWALAALLATGHAYAHVFVRPKMGQLHPHLQFDQNPYV